MALYKLLTLVSYYYFHFIKVGMTLHARVIKINHERMQLDLTCKSSDLSNEQGKFA